MKLLMLSLIFVSTANASECMLTVKNKNTASVNTVKLEPMASDRMHFLTNAVVEDFSASYESDLRTRTETLILADADGVMASTVILLGSNKTMMLKLSRNKVFASVECK